MLLALLVPRPANFRLLKQRPVNLEFTLGSTSEPPMNLTARRLGFLDSYTKEDGNGSLRSHYKVTVKSLDFVAQGPAYQERKKLESSEGGGGIQNNENRLYLWQVFFANPYEWWDHRKRKVNPKQPDFKHKDTGEALWLSQRDPPWVKRQLQLLDSKITEGGLVRPRSCVTTWVYDE